MPRDTLFKRGVKRAGSWYKKGRKWLYAPARIVAGMVGGEETRQLLQDVDPVVNFTDKLVGSAERWVDEEGYVGQDISMADLREGAKAGGRLRNRLRQRRQPVPRRPSRRVSWDPRDHPEPLD